MGHPWLGYEFLTLKKTLERLEREEDSNNICIAREVDPSGKRHYYVVDKQRFLKNYNTLKSGVHFYEVITGKCTFYFDIEYDRTNQFMVDDVTAYKLFISLVKTFLTDLYSLEENEIYYLTLDASNAKRFSKHLILRVFTEKGEFMVNDSHEVMKDIVRQLQNYLLKVMYNENATGPWRTLKKEGVNRMMKYMKNVPIQQQTKMYEVLAENYFNNDNRDAKDELLRGMFVDWNVYDRNRNIRLVNSSKMKDPGRRLVYREDQSNLPEGMTRMKDIIEFSLISKAIGEDEVVIFKELNGQEETQTKLLGTKDVRILNYTPRRKKNIERCVAAIESCLGEEGLEFNYKVISIGKISDYCIYLNVDINYCLIERHMNESNRVYFVYNVDNDVTRQKCFKCGKLKTWDVKLTNAAD